MTDTAFDQLRALLGSRFTTAQAERDLHGASESYYPPTPPEAVAFPENTQEVSAIMAICHASGTPVTCWGTGTSLEGQALAARGIVLDLRYMNRLLEVRAEDMLAVVQPGLTRMALNTELRATGLFFPVDPGADASLGGMAATRASGTTTVRYGSMRDNLRALEVVLADGQVIRTGSAAAKSAAGYDLTALMLGSEGTLGVITELTLKLHGQPEDVTAGICAFDTIEAAVNTVIEVIQSGLAVARVEFVDAATVRAFNAAGGGDWPAQPHLMVEFHGSPEGTREQAGRFAEIAADYGGRFDWASDPARRNALWAMRHGAYPAILRSRPGASAVVTDICVPISRLAEAVGMAQSVIAQAGIEGPILGHVGDGNFHAILMVDRADAAEVARAKSVGEALARGALALGGTITGEHGVGIGKRAMMAEEHGAGWQVMGAIKAALDPKGILNPGKLLPDDR